MDHPASILTSPDRWKLLASQYERNTVKPPAMATLASGPTDAAFLSLLSGAAASTAAAAAAGAPSLLSFTTPPPPQTCLPSPARHTHRDHSKALSPPSFSHLKASLVAVPAVPAHHTTATTTAPDPYLASAAAAAAAAEVAATLSGVRTPRASAGRPPRTEMSPPVSARRPSAPRSLCYRPASVSAAPGGGSFLGAPSPLFIPAAAPPAGGAGRRGARAPLASAVAQTLAIRTSQQTVHRHFGSWRVWASRRAGGSHRSQQTKLLTSAKQSAQEMTAMQQRLASASARELSLEETVDTLRKRLAQTGALADNARCEELTAALQERGAELERLRGCYTMLDEERQKTARQRAELEEKEAECRRLRADAADAASDKARCTELSALLDEGVAEREAARQAKIDDSEQKLAGVAAELQQCKEALAEAQEALREKESTALASLTELQEGNEALRLQSAVQAKELAEANDSLAAAQETEQLMKSQAADLSTLAQQAEAAHSTKQGALEQAAAEQTLRLRSLEHKAAELTQTAAAEAARASDVEALLRTRDAEVAALTAAADEGAADVAAAAETKAQLAAARAEAEALAADVAARDERAGAAEAARAEAAEKAERLEAQLATVRGRGAALEDQLAAEQQGLRKARAEVGRLQAVAGAPAAAAAAAAEGDSDAAQPSGEARVQELLRAAAEAEEKKEEDAGEMRKLQQTVAQLEARLKDQEEPAAAPAAAQPPAAASASETREQEQRLLAAQLRSSREACAGMRVEVEEGAPRRDAEDAESAARGELEAARRAALPGLQRPAAAAASARASAALPPPPRPAYSPLPYAAPAAYAPVPYSPAPRTVASTPYPVSARTGGEAALVLSPKRQMPTAPRTPVATHLSLTPRLTASSSASVWQPQQQQVLPLPPPLSVASAVLPLPPPLPLSVASAVLPLPAVAASAAAAAAAAAAQVEAEAKVPYEMVIAISSVPQASGKYLLSCADSPLRGLPVWTSGDKTLFAGAGGRWLLGANHGSMAKNRGCIRSACTHRNMLPHQVKEWETADGQGGWVPAPVQVEPLASGIWEEPSRWAPAHLGL